MLDACAEEKHFPRVAEFYHGKSVFLTGSTGLIGTILLETLLRCCPGIKSIFILIRSKKNVEPEARKGKLFNKKIFNNLKEDTPELLDKVRVIPGDISLPNLGMNDDDVQLLVSEVSIVFHCAASTSFEKPLKFVLTNNVLSLDTIIELCRRMTKFEALVYTSTAYSNCNHTKYPLMEKVYRLTFKAQKYLKALKEDDEKELRELYLHGKPDWPNTYTYSKCLAENVIKDTASDLPCAIIRPSIVLNTWKHPMPGYIEANSGIAALSLGVGKGFVKVLYADPNNKLNFVPVDIVANAHILAAWSLGTKRWIPSIPPMVVHCTATENLHVKLSEYNKIMTELTLENPLPQSFEEFSKLIIVPNKYLYYIVSAYHHYLPAIILDRILKFLKKKPRVYSMYRFYDTVMSSLNFFMFHTFETERDNLEHLDSLICPEDRKDFSLDFRDATFEEVTMNIPEASPFYDWKIDRKTKKERQRTKYRRHLIIKAIQGTFLLICSLFIYWVYYLICR